MIEYPKIQTLFLRDEKSIIIPNKFTYPEFEYLKDCKWECTEKIDGTNMSFQLTPNDFSDGHVEWNTKIYGRTERANIPPLLQAKMQEIFSIDTVKKVFNLSDSLETESSPIEIYGEGFGKKIQSCGGRYLRDSVDFILFDVKIGNWWLTREALEDIAHKLNIQIVPLIGYMTLTEAIEYVKTGFTSTISEDKTLAAEGLVLKTPIGLKNRKGDRIITKIKTCDFTKWNAAYGSCKSIVQTTNKHYES